MLSSKLGKILATVKNNRRFICGQIDLLLSV